MGYFRLLVVNKWDGIIVLVESLCKLYFMAIVGLQDLGVSCYASIIG